MAGGTHPLAPRNTCLSAITESDIACAESKKQTEQRALQQSIALRAHTQIEAVAYSGQRETESELCEYPLLSFLVFLSEIPYYPYFIAIATGENKQTQVMT